MTPLPSGAEVTGSSSHAPATDRWSLRVHGRVVASFRSWPGQPNTAHLMLHDVLRQRFSSGTLDAWLREIAESGFGSVRTNAVPPAVGHDLASAGFEVVQRLVLLGRALPLDSGRASTAPVRVGPLDLIPLRTLRIVSTRSGWLQQPSTRRRATVAACELDAAAFGPDWRLDDAALHDACRATPRHRVRALVQPEPHRAQLLGYAVTGLAHTDGYLQRLAVHPDARHQGVGSRLVDDSLTWLGRRGARRVFVNTDTKNEVALTLYRSRGFVERADGLVVLARTLTAAVPDGDGT